MDDDKGAVSGRARPALRGALDTRVGTHCLPVVRRGGKKKKKWREKKKRWIPRKEEFVSPLCPLRQLSAFLLKGPRNRRRRVSQSPG